MLTYTFEKSGGVSLYEQLYRHIKSDILSGVLAAGEKLPSKRTLAAHLEGSVITGKNAYEQLIAEGYICGVEKRGYYVMRIDQPLTAAPSAMTETIDEPPERQWFMDFVTNSTAAEYFPFATWTKLLRQTILEQDTHLLRPTPSTGALELRQAIADYLHQFRGMRCRPGRSSWGPGRRRCIRY